MNEIGVAISVGKLDTVKKLVPSQVPFNSNINLTDTTFKEAIRNVNPSLLSVAVFYGNLDVVQYLLQNGASVHLQDDTVEEKKEEGLKFFLPYQNIAHLKDNEGITPFFCSLLLPTKDIMGLLLERFGTVILEDTTNEGQDIFLYMTKNRSFASFRELFKVIYPTENPIFYGIVHGSIELLQYMLEPNDFHMRNVVGQTLVKMALEHSQIDTALFLLQGGAPCDFTDVAYLCSCLPLERVMFLKTKFDWKSASENGEPFSMFALRPPFNPTLFHFAVKCGIDPYKEEKNGISPLYRIIVDNNRIALEILLHNGFKPTYKDKPLLQLFAKSRNSTMLLTLLSNGVEQKNEEGIPSALSLAIGSREAACKQYETNEKECYRDLQAMFNIKVFDRNFGAALVLIAQKNEIGVDEVISAATKFDIPALFFYLICGRFNTTQIAEIQSKSPVRNGFTHQMCEYFLVEESNRYQQTKFSNFTFAESSLLHIAAKYSPPDTLNRIIKKGFDIDAYDEFGIRPIDYALDSCRFDNVMALVRAYVDVTPSNADHPTILHSLAANPRLQHMLEEDPTIFQHELFEFVEYSLDQGQSLMALDHHGLTPLLVAASNNNFALCKVFLQAGAQNEYIDNEVTFVHLLFGAYNESLGDPFSSKMGLFRYTTADQQPAQPFLGQLAIDVLLQPGVSNSLFKNGDTVVHLCTKFRLAMILDAILKAENAQKSEIYSAVKNTQNNNGDTAVHIAAREGDMQIMQILVENGCDVNPVDQMMRTPLMIALMQKNSRCALYLLSVGAAINVFDINGRTPLHYALIYENYTFADIIMNETDTPLGSMDMYGRTPVFYACNKDEQCFILLQNFVKLGVNIFVQDYKGRTLMHMACKKGAREIVEYLMDSIPISWADDCRITPLHLAVKHGNLKCVLAYGKAKIEAFWLKDHRGDTPLHYACRYNQPQIVEAILKLAISTPSQNPGGEPSVTVVPPNPMNYAGETPIVLAAALGNTLCVGAFYNRGSDALVESDGFLVLRRVLLEGNFEYAKELIAQSGVSVRARHHGRTLLGMAAERNEPVIVRFLVQHGACEQIGRMDMTPLAIAYVMEHREVMELLAREYQGMRIADLLERFMPGLSERYEAARKAGQRELEYLKKVVINYGSDRWVDEMESYGSRISNTLHDAIVSGDFDTVRLCIQSGADPNRASGDGSTPLIAAVTTNFLEAAEVLIHIGADPNRPDETGQYPVMAAVKQGRTDFFELFVQSGGRLSILDKDGLSIFHIIARDNLTNFIPCMFMYGANVYELDRDGRTPLHLAVENDHSEIAEALVKMMQRTEFKDNKGVTPVEIAQQQNNSSMLQLLDVKK